MSFVPAQDEWPVGGSTTPATGPVTTVGNLALTRAVHRAGGGLPATITDNSPAGNVWHPLGPIEAGGVYRGVVAGGSGDVYYWYAVVTSPFTAVDVRINANPANSRTVFVREWAGNATEDALLDVSWRANPSMAGPLPVAEVTTNVDGALIAGVLGATVSNRTFDLLTAGYTAGREHRANQTTLISASNPAAPPGTHGPQWSLGGTSSTTGVITAAFRPAGTTPPPGPATGTAVAHATWAAAATGRTTRRGTATTTHTWQATATGTSPALADHTGTAAAPHTWQTTAAGTRESRGRATVEHGWDARAAGVAPDVDAAAGSASARHRWGVTATGTRPSHGTARARHDWAPVAVGRTSRAGHARADVTWAVAAAGTSAEARDITLTVLSVAGHPLTAHGPRTHPLTTTGPTGHPLTVTHVRS